MKVKLRRPVVGLAIVAAKLLDDTPLPGHVPEDPLDQAWDEAARLYLGMVEQQNLDCFLWLVPALGPPAYPPVKLGDLF
jgi:hypothetical protein